ncbi:serine/threonine protein kinase [Thiolinea disciformis]|uniref:serine/threonine protein kinase n=1 Tax=Thiolinea disciformis TaxID=125614 RepID=UPI00037F0AB5|nr:serine/threonine-protein kinase [Thiolinea disciformis]
MKQLALERQTQQIFKIVFINASSSTHLNLEFILYHTFPDAVFDYYTPDSLQNWHDFVWQNYDLVMLEQGVVNDQTLAVLSEMRSMAAYFPVTTMIQTQPSSSAHTCHDAFDLCLSIHETALDLAAKLNITLELIRTLRHYPLRLAGWQLEELLHSSENSLVFLARNAQGEKAAVKRFKFDVSGANKEDIWGFLTSARTLIWFDHVGLAGVRDADVYQNAVYLVMEYVEGTSLRTLLNEKPRPSTQQVLAWFEQITKALGAMHDIDLLHLDLKSSNIMVRPNGQTVLLDFGIEGKLLVETGFLQASEIYCTPFYVSPERIVGEPASVQSDLYALGVLFYEMLVGDKPYKGFPLSAILQQHIFDPIPKLPEVFAHYQPLLDSLMAKSLELRPVSTYEALKLLKACELN